MKNNDSELATILAEMGEMNKVLLNRHQFMNLSNKASAIKLGKDALLSFAKRSISWRDRLLKLNMTNQGIDVDSPATLELIDRAYTQFSSWQEQNLVDEKEGFVNAIQALLSHSGNVPTAEIEPQIDASIEVVDDVTPVPAC